MRKINTVLFWSALLIPALFLFKAFFLPGPLVWGDAPFYNAESLSRLVGEPYSWVHQSLAGLGKVNNLYWIYPISLLYGIVYRLTGLSTDILIRLLFYYPALLSALISPVLLGRYLKLSKATQFFTSLLYVFNTYFILVVDGGQIGVALAYGIFPLSLLFLRKLYDKPQVKQFCITLFVFMLLVSADARIAIICFLTFVLWTILESVTGKEKPNRNQLKAFLFFGLSTVGLSTYWLLPAIKLVSTSNVIIQKPLELVSLLNATFLYQPHWPANEYGRIVPVPFYFVGIPLLVFCGLFLPQQKPPNSRKRYIYALCVLIFAYLAKGTTPPLGGVYDLLVNRVPLGSAFQDSSKFFIPIILFSGILIGGAVDQLALFIRPRGKNLSKVFVGVAALYLVSLVYPALSGHMNGVLAGRRMDSAHEVISNLIRNTPDSFRTVWFPENHPWAYTTFEKPAVDARSLVDTRPLATLNTGTQDRFNFVHDKSFLDWFDLFGIKYLVFAGDPRKHTLNEEEQYDWNNLVSLTDSIPELKKVGNTSVPMYEVPQVKPHIFASDKVFVVVGGESIYQKVKTKNSQFSPANQPFIFAEDGKWDPERLFEIASASARAGRDGSDSAVLVLNEKHDEDLTLSLLQKYFVSPSKNSQWALRGAGDYLRYKYELLVNNIDFEEFDYGKGIAFSTKKGEKVKFNLTVPQDGSYVTAYREWNNDGFHWVISQPQDLKRGTHPLTLENDGGVKVVNVAALIPKADWDAAWKQKEELTGKFKVVSVGKDELNGLDKLTANNWVGVNEKEINPTKYSLTVPEDKHWIVFTDSFNSGWVLRQGGQESNSLPFYSAINGFYLPSSPASASIEFTGQKYVTWGLYGTLATAMALLLFGLKRLTR